MRPSPLCRSEQSCRGIDLFALGVITQKPRWDVRAVLDTAGLSATTREYPRGEAVYTQGDPADGTTLPHVTLFMKKFNRLGFIDSHRPSGDEITINSSLLGVVLRD